MTRALPLLASAVLLLGSLCFASSAFCFPVILNSSHLAPLFGSVRNQLIALKADESGPRRVALQIDEVEDDAALVLREPYEEFPLRKKLAHPGKNDPFAGRLKSVHRIVLDDRDFGVCSAECKKKLNESVKTLCLNPRALITTRVTLIDSNKELFLADCGLPMKPLSERSISFNLKKKQISTPNYEYSFESEKNIFFKDIKVSPNSSAILSRSELKAFLKPKYLFNMKFRDDDLISQITSLSQGSQSLSLEVAMALNLLAMKINNQICCDVSFYEDALYFPVVLDLPFSGNSFAKGSGVFFGFQSDDKAQVQTEFIPAKTPEASDAFVFRQDKNIITLGMRNPNRKSAELVRPKIVSKKDLLEMAFMPVESLTGIFYDIQNAKEGFQHFNVWMFFGKEEEKAKLIDYAQNGPKFTVDSWSN
jgi:hypothetical protein